MAYQVRKGFYLMAGFLALATPGVLAHPAMAQEADGDEEGHKGPDMHKLAAKPPLPRAHKDFSKFRYVPEGDKVKEQADSNRLLFWTATGQPDGYAQRRGDSIIYYDAQGKAIRVQRLQPGELDD